MHSVSHSIFGFSYDVWFLQWMAASLYFGYTFVNAASFFLLTSTVGYFSCQWFINVIYSSIKVRQVGQPSGA